MLIRLISIVLTLVILTSGVALSETQEAQPDQLYQDMPVDDFILSLNSEWVIKEASEEEKDNGVIRSAETWNKDRTMMVFSLGDGNADQVAELAALNDYSGVAKRDEKAVLGNVSIIYAISEENGTAYAYLSANEHMYSIVVSSIEGKVDAATLLAELKEIMNTISLNEV